MSRFLQIWWQMLSLRTLLQTKYQINSKSRVHLAHGSFSRIRPKKYPPPRGSGYFISKITQPEERQQDMYLRKHRNPDMQKRR